MSNNMIIGDGIIEMSESDFIELTTRLGNDINKCCFDDADCNKVTGQCEECWAEYLRTFIKF